MGIFIGTKWFKRLPWKCSPECGSVTYLNSCHLACWIRSLILLYVNTQCMSTGYHFYSQVVSTHYFVLHWVFFFTWMLWKLISFTIHTYIIYLLLSNKDLADHKTNSFICMHKVLRLSFLPLSCPAIFAWLSRLLTVHKVTAPHGAHY